MEGFPSYVRYSLVKRFETNALGFPAKKSEVLEGNVEMLFNGVQAGKLDLIDGETLKKLWQLKRVMYMVHVESLKNDALFEEVPSYLQQVIGEYKEVLDIPKGLPPVRSCDHRIPFIDPQQFMYARPYRYPFHQKNEGEKLIKEMLESRIIRESSSPFASPDVLGKQM